jgi:hypothetical protein
VLSKLALATFSMNFKLIYVRTQLVGICVCWRCLVRISVGQSWLSQLHQVKSGQTVCNVPFISHPTIRLCSLATDSVVKWSRNSLAEVLQWNDSLMKWWLGERESGSLLSEGQPLQRVQKSPQASSQLSREANLPSAGACRPLLIWLAVSSYLQS